MAYSSTSAIIFATASAILSVPFSALLVRSAVGVSRRGLTIVMLFSGVPPRFHHSSAVDQCIHLLDQIRSPRYKHTLVTPALVSSSAIA